MTPRPAPRPAGDVPAIHLAQSGGDPQLAAGAAGAVAMLFGLALLEQGFSGRQAAERIRERAVSGSFASVGPVVGESGDSPVTVAATTGARQAAAGRSKSQSTAQVSNSEKVGQ